jgi:hypothetical protein
MFKVCTLATALLAVVTFLSSIEKSHAALACTPMSNTQANTQFAGKWLLALTHQVIGLGEGQFATITLNQFGTITSATGDGLPITGNLKVAPNCRVTGTITARFGPPPAAITYTIGTGVIHEAPANVASFMMLRAKPPTNPAVLFSLIQSP